MNEKKQVTQMVSGSWKGDWLRAEKRLNSQVKRIRTVPVPFPANHCGAPVAERGQAPSRTADNASLSTKPVGASPLSAKPAHNFRS